ncbi:MAG: POTRA domain-containing protein [Terriglobales bacterium]
MARWIVIRRRLVMAAAALAAIASPLLAQVNPNQPLAPIASLTASGSARFTPDRLVAATDLKAGQVITVTELRQAANRRAGSGEFSKVTYSFDDSRRGTDIQFQVSDQPYLLPVAFDNFVWMPREQVIARLRSKIPLFSGELPEHGNVDQQVTAALQDILKQQGVSGASVNGMALEGGISAGSATSYAFFVSGVKIPVQGFLVAGVPAQLVPAMRKDLGFLLGGNYSRSQVEEVSRLRLFPELQDRGYIRAKLDPPVARLIAPGRQGVSVSLTFITGSQYRWGTVRCGGNTVFGSKQILGLVKVRSGRLADMGKLNQGIAAIGKLYGSRGYLFATTMAHSDFSQPGVAGEDLAITEGSEFYMGAVSFGGSSAPLAAKLSRLWKLAPGEPYNAGYLPQYVLSLGKRFPGFAFNYSISPDKSRRTVKVTVVPWKFSR